MAASIFRVDAYQEYIARRRASEAADGAAQPVTQRPSVPSRTDREPQRLEYEWSKPWWYMLYLADSIERHGSGFLEERFDESGVSAVIGSAIALGLSATAAAIGTFGLIWSWVGIAIIAPVWLPLWSVWRLCRRRS